MNLKNENTEFDISQWKRTGVTTRLIRQQLGTTFQRILVVGCGSGFEAVVFAQKFKGEVVGIDLDTSAFSPWAVKQVDLRKGDATNLEFPDNHFDLVYSFHVLEHISQFPKAITEMARVLTDRGGIFIGTPNRARLIGYLGSETATWCQRLVWNWYDTKARWQGRFENKYGAHAGFLPRELKIELERVFSQIDEITIPYYLELYEKHPRLVRFIDRSGLGRYLFPAIFFVGRK